MRNLALIPWDVVVLDSTREATTLFKRVQRRGLITSTHDADWGYVWEERPTLLDMDLSPAERTQKRWESVISITLFCRVKEKTVFYPVVDPQSGSAVMDEIFNLELERTPDENIGVDGK